MYITYAFKNEQKNRNLTAEKQSEVINAGTSD